MNDITNSTITNIPDPKFSAVGERVLQTFRLSLEKALAHQASPGEFHLDTAPDSVEQMFLSRFKTLPAEKQQAAMSKAVASAQAPAEQRAALYGDLAKVDLRLPTPVTEQV